MGQVFHFISPSSVGVAENVASGRSVYVAAASISGVTGRTFYSLWGGADAALFSLGPDTGDLSFKAAPDYEAPADAGADNVYNVQIRSVEVETSPAQSQIQFRNAAWDGSGLVTAEIWTTASNLDSFDLVIGATGGSGLGFVSSAHSGWTVMPNELGNQFLVSGYSLEPLGAGPVLLGTLSMHSYGSEAHLLIDAGTDIAVAGNSTSVSPYDIGFYQAVQGVAITVADVPEVGKLGKDFNGDGKSDILLQNANDGSCYAWQMNGLTLAANGAGFVGWIPGKDWQAKANGDFNGDGKSDILLQNAIDGACYVWEMNGLTLAANGAGFVGWTPGKDWQVKASGDFNGDGKSDILLQSATDGACYVWEMNGLTLAANGAGFVGWTPGRDWQVKASGDFNGDGKSDILLQNAIDGSCYVWELNGLSLAANGAGSVGWAPGKDWQVKASGDFNGDGKSDILLQNANDGACYVWEMDGLTIIANGAGFVGWAPGKDWQVKATGDFNGDGKSDILLQNVMDGACYVWEMNGLNLAADGAGFVGWIPGADWHATV